MKPPRRNLATPRRPFVVAFEGEKGGTGKSTAALCLIAEAFARGETVLPVDTDEQRTLGEWVQEGNERGFHRLMVLDTAEPHRLVQSFTGHSLVVIDCPGRLDVTQRSALAVCDLAIFPCRPGKADYRSFEKKTRPVVEEALRHRPELLVRILLNAWQPTKIARHYTDEFRALPGLPIGVFDAMLGHRTTYGEALDSGCGPRQIAPQSAAAAEVSAFVDEIFALRRTAWAGSHTHAARV